MDEVKNVYDQIADLKSEISEIKTKPRTIYDQINDNEPIVFDFVKNAKRVWRYSYEKSELRRKNKKKKQTSIVALCFLFLYIIIPFLFIAKPLGWIMPIVSCIVCIPQIIIQIHKIKPREYEVEYDKLLSFWRYAELDDNDIISATKDKWWVIMLRIAILLLQFAIGVEFLIYFDNGLKILGIMLIVLCSLTLLPFRDSTIYGYQLHFVDDKNDIEYHILKDFMNRNNLK